MALAERMMMLPMRTLLALSLAVGSPELKRIPAKMRPTVEMAMPIPTRIGTAEVMPFSTWDWARAGAGVKSARVDAAPTVLGNRIKGELVSGVEAAWRLP